ncbi:MAG: hypothetical protein K0R30_1498 [Ornithinibacter sp.]|jgi:hypothetical protein|nr:hypothetical protein [Ornithinibacter sp.]
MTVRANQLPASARQVVDTAASAGGVLLAAAFGTLARVRGGRPLHPQGATYAATVAMTGQGLTGVPWLDERGLHRVTVRVSRSAGLPLWMPDVYGIALRATMPDERAVDLLFATTGDTPTGRFVLRPRRGVERGPLTTLLPVRSEGGPLLLRLVPAVPGPVEELSLPTTLTLSCATGRGPWHDVGVLAVGAPLGPDAEAERHDPVLHELPGSEQYPVLRRLREPAYRAARRVGTSSPESPEGHPRW